MSDSPPLTRGQFCAREQIIDRFEQAWQEGPAPTLESFLAESQPADRLALLTELVAIDLEYRWQHGSAVLVEEYFEQYPELAADGAAQRQLILHECRVRRQFSLAPSPQELFDRFGEQFGSVPFPEEPESNAAAGDIVFGDDPMQEASPSPGVGTDSQSLGVCLGRYRLTEQLGRGGFATVWRAWDTRLKRQVALKVPHAELAANPEMIRRLWREIHIAARIRHDSIVPIHEVGQADGKLFVVYQLIEGESLAALIQQGRPDWKQAAQWVVRISEAVLVAHQAGIIHRDIKPANIIIDETGSPVLTDFGLACLADRSDIMTHEGDFLGTPAYMAPELAMGQGHRADHRCDIYSLGAVLYELLAGRPPFVGRPVSIVQQVATRDPPPLRQSCSTLPRDLETICRKAMAREPDRRYATAGELAVDLRRWLENRPIAARPLGPLARFTLWCRRQPILAATIAVALVICLGVTGVGFVRVVGERNRFEAQRNEARSHLFNSLVNEAEARIRARETGWAQQALSAIARAGQIPTANQDRFHLRNVALECLTSPYPSFHLFREWDSGLDRLDQIAISPEGDWIAASGSGAAQAIQIWRTGSASEPWQLPTHPGGTTCLAFSPDGRWLASGGVDQSVRVWEVGSWTRTKTDGLPVGEWLLASGPVCDVSWSPDSHALAAACQDGNVFWIGFRLPNENVAKCIAKHQNAARCVAFTPDGESIASGGDDRTVRLTAVTSPGTLRLWHVADAVRSLAITADGLQIIAVEPTSYGFNRIVLSSGTMESRATMHRSPVTCVVTDAGHAEPGLVNRRNLLTASLDGTIRLWSDSDTPRAVISGAYPGVLSIDSTADSKTLAAGYVDGRIRLWRRWNPPGVTGSRLNAEVVAFGNNQVFDGNRVWNIAAHDLMRSRSLSPPPIHLIALDGTGYRVAIVRQNGDEAEPQVQLWTTHTRLPIAKWSAGTSPVIALLFVASRQQWLTMGEDGIIRLWNDDGQQCADARVNLSKIDRLIANRDGSLLIVIGESGVQGWRVGESAFDLAWEESWEYRTVLAAAMTPDYFVVSSEQHGLEVRGTADGRLRGRLSGNRSPVVALASAPDELQVAGAARDYSVHIWNVEEQSLLLSLDHGGPAVADHIVWHPGRPWIALSRFDYPTVWWDISQRRLLANMEATGDHTLAFGPGGHSLYLCSKAGGLRVVAVEELASLLEDAGVGASTTSTTGVWINIADTLIPGGHDGLVWGAAISPDGRMFATAGHDGTVKLWDAASLSLLETKAFGADVAWCVAFSPDGRWLAAGSSLPLDGQGQSPGRVHVWDQAQNQLSAILETHRRLVVSIAFHPLHPLMVTSGLDGEVWLWKLDEKVKGWRLGRFDAPLPKLAFHPNGKVLVGASRNHNLAFWSVDELLGPVTSDDTAPGLKQDEPTFPEPQWLSGHTESVWAVTFSHDGQLMASGGELGTVILWNCSTWQPVAEFRQVSDRIRSLAFSPDQATLAVGTFPANGPVIHLDRLRNELNELGLNWPD